MNRLDEWESQDRRRDALKEATDENLAVVNALIYVGDSIGRLCGLLDSVTQELPPDDRWPPHARKVRT